MRFALYSLLLLLALAIPAGALAQGSAILTSDNPADLAVARALAAHLQAEVVVTEWGRVTNESLQQLLNMSPGSIYIIGGEKAVPGAEVELEKLGLVGAKRLNGSNRYETAALAAKEWEEASLIIMAHGYDEAVMEAAVERAVEEDAPLLFLPADEVPAFISSSISMLSPEKALIIPSPNMVEDSLSQALSALGLSVELLPQDFRASTKLMIEKANISIAKAEGTAFTQAPSQGDKAFAEALLGEAKEDLEAAEHWYELGAYNLSYTRAVLAKYNADSASYVKKGVLRLPVEKVRIADILLRPGEYDGREVQVQGKIEGAIVAGENAYVQLYDGTGTIMLVFPADREYMLEKGILFFAFPDVIGKSAAVNGTVRLNVPLNTSEGAHGSSTFAYLLEVDTARLLES